ncbi:MAG: methyltransferase domain-containing protein [Candidatus Thiothrix putei]|uniref:Methyltransferase domain-containing protein n=1 Tax=Candidatus Thiothrix putei TaxID=3080811 RepID=A0AA95HAM9_9GAMM|nr:MAG: methyltransferase domain-containing protein [Candidatus Thiothrix putei]
MNFTGERYIPTEQGRIRMEHYHRYAMVLELIKGKTVLDVACGEGYGSAMMAEVAHSVIGVDISHEAVAHASETYEKKNLQFQQGSAVNLNFSDNTFDVVVSFETIEHLVEQEQMLAEIRRVLHSNGIFIISSPNRPVYSEESGEHNEFHVKELDFQEFDTLLRTQFSLIQYAGQRLQIASVIQPLDIAPDTASVWSDNGNDLNANAGILQSPIYFIAVCGSAMSPLPDLKMSTLYPESLDLLKHYVGFARWAQALEKIVTERDTQIVNFQQAIVNLQQAIVERDNHITGLLASYSWKVTAPLRKGKELTILFLPKLKHFIKILLAEVKRYYYTLPVSWQLNMKRYAKAGLRFIKHWYQALPFSIETKSKHRQWIAKLSPRILTATGSHPGTLPAYTSPLLQSPLARSTLANPKTLVIPSSENPVISIIIPIYGKIDYTIRCIASISLNPPNTAFEIIVVDDCSPDDSYNTLSEVNGIRLIRNAQNQGFIRSCNNGAHHAIGEYLLFLNNDTEVFPDWADELLRTFHEFPGTGLAGSKLVYPNGLLQEAGGIIWQDGSAWNFGRCQDPTLPVYNYAREVDYCSGASIMIPKDLFNELGGFDELYTPAYCEDSDLALKIRDKGYRVIYQPLSVVIHYEGITSGTDLTQGAKAYQVVNTQKQFERWNNRLKLHQAPGQHVDQAKDRAATRRVLFIDHCTPTPNKDSGSIDAYNHMLLLREMGFQVTFIPEDNFFYMPEYTPALQRVGVEMLYAPTVTSVEQHVKEYGSRYDLVFLNRLAVFEHHIKTIRRYCTKAKVLFHTVDLHFLRVAREAALHQTSSLTQRAEDIKQREINAILTADIATVISTEELELLKPLLAKDVIRLLPYSRQPGGMTTGFQGRKDLVFVGSYQHAPNVDAVKYFAETVMPLLRKQLPQVRFYAVGSTPPPEIQALASDDIIITGFIENLTPLLDKMRLSVAPLRYGAGIKGKIGSAMSVGLPVVATTIAIEGMGLTDGENVVVADTPQAIADAISLLYHDETRWNQISQNSQFFAEKHWGAAAAWLILADIVTELGMPVTRNTYPLSLYSEFLAVPTPMPNTALLPVGSAHDQQQYQELLKHSTIKDHQGLAQQYLAQIDSEMFTVNGFCVPCNRNVSLLVDAQFGGQYLTTGWQPNWRERLECPLCKMNNRQRLIATLIHQALANTAGKSLYFMEQVTPIYQWAVTTFPQHQVIGSEYLGHQYASGSTINGIRHEDVENLSFANEKFDFIISNDVFEHVPHPAQAFAECARVLKPQGIMLASIPFHVDQRTSVNRAQLLDKGRLAHHLPPMYHGNPISAEGSLVFTDFGWDILNTLKDAGFSDATIDMYSAPEYGHLGDVQLIFKATKLNN